MNHVALSKSVPKFMREVVEPLSQRKLVTVDRAGMYSVTPAGLAFLNTGILPAAVEQPVAQGRYVHPIQPLSSRHRFPRPLRAGAFDYRDIPSRCANQCVPFKSSIKPESE